MKSLGRLCFLLLLSALSAQVAHAVVYTSLYGRVTAADATGPLYYQTTLTELAPPGLGNTAFFNDLQFIRNIALGSIFLPDQTSLVQRNGSSSPSDYEVVAVGSSGNPLTVGMNSATDPYKTNIGVMNIKGIGGELAGWDSMLLGNLEADPSTTPPRTQDISSAAVSLMYSFDQHAVAFGLTGIDIYNSITNPDSNMFVDFYARDGSLIDRLTMMFNRKTILDPGTMSLLFRAVPGADLIAGITLTTSDTRGLAYGIFTYDTPEPPGLTLILPVLAGLLAWNSMRRQLAPSRHLPPH